MQAPFELLGTQGVRLRLFGGMGSSAFIRRPAGLREASRAASALGRLNLLRPPPSSPGGLLQVGGAVRHRR